MKTTKNYYTHAIINSEECNKYMDVECEYGLKRKDEFSDEYDNILYYNGRYIIYKDDLTHLYI